MGVLTGRTVLVTGASRGIGAAAAKAARAAGARVVLHASSPSDSAIKAAEAADGELIFGDLAMPGAGALLMTMAVKRAGRIDAVVNNAGIYIPSPLTGSHEDWAEGWAQTMAVNVQAPADVCRAAIAHFREHGGGIVINVASRAGHRGDGPDHAAYAASKGALLAMTKTFARAFSGEHILFYAIAPGWVETRMAPQDIENRKAAVKDIPLGRVASPEEVAEMIVSCVSGACPSATGATFDINGASYVR